MDTFVSDKQFEVPNKTKQNKIKNYIRKKKFGGVRGERREDKILC